MSGIQSLDPSLVIFSEWRFRGEIKFEDINIPVIDCHTEETLQSDSHNIPAYNSHEYYRSHVQLLQGRFFPPYHGFKRNCHVSSYDTFS